MKPYLVRLAACALWMGLAGGCDVGHERLSVPDPSTAPDVVEGQLVCRDAESRACLGGRHFSCVRRGEFLEAQVRSCLAEGLDCDEAEGCVRCMPGRRRCQGDTAVIECREDASGFDLVDECFADRGSLCVGGRCVDACAVAASERSYVGCEFYAVDLDNAALNVLDDASAQQYAVGISNPHDAPVTVTIEINEAPFGEPPQVRVLERVVVAPRLLEVVALPRREVDGSSATGVNDGTHSALSSHAFRVRTSLPVSVYQFNPLENVDVFSNDASLLLPVSAIGDTYTVVAWPQTIGDSEDPSRDFDSTTSEEDLRAFLTIVGTAEATDVRVELGDDVGEVVAAPGIEGGGPNESLAFRIGPFDVVNLETNGFGADFTGSHVEATAPVSVFVGSEASDVPTFGTYATRQCCADHLEAQLYSDGTLGTRFLVARMPPRTAALNAAFVDQVQVAMPDEPEWVRVVATRGETTVRTSLPFPYDSLALNPRESVMLEADRDFWIEADYPIAVLQALPSQEVTGIPSQYPGGDPALVALPPVEQFREDYVFLTPDKYAFDFIVVVARAHTAILLDGAPLPDHCRTSQAPPGAGGDGEDWVVHRCQLSFPEVTAEPGSEVRDGQQDDGVHRLVASEEVGLVVYGFDRFVSYAYAGGLNLTVLQ